VHGGLGNGGDEEIGLPQSSHSPEMKGKLKRADNGNPLRQYDQNETFASMRESGDSALSRLQEEKEFPA